MSTSSPSHLSADQLKLMLSNFDPIQSVSVVRVRSHNKAEIRRTETMEVAELTALVLTAYEEGHLLGGDLEVLVPGNHQKLKLVGHHDGIFWLEGLE